MLFAGSPAPSANSIIYNSKTTKPQPRFAAGVFACFSCEINQNQRTPSHTLPKKAGNRFGNRTLGQTRRWRASHQAHGRANMLHRPLLSPSRAFCAPAQWRQAQHKRCHRLCTISRSAHNIRSRQLQRFSARRLRGGFASAIPHPIFRACRHCQTLCESPAGIAMDRRQNLAGSWYSRPADNRPADWTNHSKRPQ